MYTSLQQSDRIRARLGLSPREVRYDLEASTGVRFRNGDDLDGRSEYKLANMARTQVARRLQLNAYSVATSEAIDKIDEAAFELLCQCEKRGANVGDGGWMVGLP